MKGRKIKVLISVLLIFVLVFSLVGCGDKKNENQTETEESDSETDANVESLPYVKAYLWDRTNIEIEGKMYYDYLIEVYSDQCYSYPTDDSIIFKNDNEYKKISEVFSDVKVDTYCINKDLGGTTEYFIKIRSPKLLDTKKIFIYFVGMKEFDPKIELNDYTESLPEDKNIFVSILLLSEINNKMSFSAYEIPNRLGNDYIITDSGYVFYYTGSTEKMFVKDNTVWQKIDIDPVNHGDLNELAQYLEYSGFAYLSENAKTNKDVKSMFYNDEYIVKTKVEDGNVYIGYTTKDGSELNESFKPDAFAIIRNAEYNDKNEVSNIEECEEFCNLFKINYGE